MHQHAIQDLIPGNHCYGCGSTNVNGLAIKSYWIDENHTQCRFTPSTSHCAGPKQFVNGGIISTLIDCHAICTAIAKGYELAGRTIGEGETIWFVTGSLQVDFLRPTPMDCELTITAQITAIRGKKMELLCEVLAGDQLTCKAKVLAIQVSDEWLQGQGA